MTLEPSTHFDIKNVQVEVDKFENELFLQAEVDYWNGNENIISVQAELSIYQSGGYQLIGSFHRYYSPLRNQLYFHVFRSCVNSHNCIRTARRISTTEPSSFSSLRK